MQKLKNEELGRPDLIAYQQIKKLPIIMVLDNVRSALNVGSVFRSSDAFRVEKIILCGITAQPPHKEVLKTAIGATESVQWEYFEDTKEAVKHLKSEKVKVYAIEQASNSIDLREFIPSDINNLLKIIAIYMRLRANIPVIIMGETGNFSYYF